MTKLNRGLGQLHEIYVQSYLILRKSPRVFKDSKVDADFLIKPSPKSPCQTEMAAACVDRDWKVSPGFWYPSIEISLHKIGPRISSMVSRLLHRSN
jgi:hypothetical protein